MKELTEKEKQAMKKVKAMLVVCNQFGPAKCDKILDKLYKKK